MAETKRLIKIGDRIVNPNHITQAYRSSDNSIMVELVSGSTFKLSGAAGEVFWKALSSRMHSDEIKVEERSHG